MTGSARALWYECLHLKMNPDRSNQKDSLAVEASPQCANQHLLEIGLVEVEEGENAGDEHCNSPAKAFARTPRMEGNQTSSGSGSSGKSEGLLTASAQVHRIMTTVSQTSLMPMCECPAGCAKSIKGHDGVTCN
jgi:hypothetical protein